MFYYISVGRNIFILLQLWSSYTFWTWFWPLGRDIRNKNIFKDGLKQMDIQHVLL